MAIGIISNGKYWTRFYLRWGGQGKREGDEGGEEGEGGGRRGGREEGEEGAGGGRGEEERDGGKKGKFLRAQSARRSRREEGDEGEVRGREGERPTPLSTPSFEDNLDLCR